MKLSLLTLAAAAGLASSQCVSDIPECARSCLMIAAGSVGCGETDYACQCTDANQQDITTNATTCVLAACGEQTALNEVRPAADAFCSAINAGESCASASAGSTGTSSTGGSPAPSSTPDTTPSTTGSGSMTGSMTSTGTGASASSTSEGSSTASSTATVTESSESGTGTGTATDASASASSTAGAAKMGSVGSLGIAVLGALVVL